MIKGPALIGRNYQLRHNAYFRENVILGDNCVVGNSCEVKNSILLNHAGAPHFNYIGDSILGYHAHLGAGVKISNVKLVPGNIMVDIDGQPFDTGLRKFGALLGDLTDIGCNAVLNRGVSEHELAWHSPRQHDREEPGRPGSNCPPPQVGQAERLYLVPNDQHR
jgi:NDP-sugar pyrophosphorylase family protein